MSNEEYAPFPEAELRALARWHEQARDSWKTDSRMHAEHERRRLTCVNAIKAHEALRDRMLRAELVRDHGFQVKED